MTIHPIYDNVLIKPVPKVERTAGGLFIPETANDKTPTQGSVIAVGHGRLLEDGTVLPMVIKVGDTVLFGKYSGTQLEIGGDKLVMMKENDIFAVLRD